MIRADVDLSGKEPLRGRILHTAKRILCVVARERERLGDAEVENLHLARRSDADIAWLQVTMNNASNGATFQGGRKVVGVIENL